MKNHWTKYLKAFTLKQKQDRVVWGKKEPDSLVFLKSPSTGEQWLTSELQIYKMCVLLRDYLCHVLLFNKVIEVVQW